MNSMVAIAHHGSGNTHALQNLMRVLDETPQMDHWLDRDL